MKDIKEKVKEKVKEEAQNQPGVTASITRAALFTLGRLFGNPVKVFKPYKTDWMDLMRQRLHYLGHQPSSEGFLRSSSSVISMTITHTGYAGLFRFGVMPLLSDSVLGAVMFSSYLYFLDEGDNPRVVHPVKETIVAGGLAGIIQGVLACPIENWLHKPNRPTKWESRRRQFGSLFSNMHLTILRDCVGIALFFSSYEASRALLLGDRGSKDKTTILEKVVNIGGIVASGAVAGGVYRLSAQPFISTQQYRNNCVSQIHEEEISHQQYNNSNNTRHHHHRHHYDHRLMPTLTAMESIYNKHGLRGFFLKYPNNVVRSFQSLARVIPFSVVGIVIFEWARTLDVS